MKVLVTGATGFIGRALVPALQREGHEVTVWVRSEGRARSLLGADVSIVTDRSRPNALELEAGRADAVVNLAGEPILGKRWTAARRVELRESRVGVTERLVRGIAAVSTRPRVLVSSSAVGYYGDRGDEVLDEASAPGSDFLAGVCQAWEDAARRAEAEGVRVVLIRTGVVLGREGGALAQMLPPFRMGVGGPIASGRQFMPWIHLHDFVQIIVTALADDRYRGPINAVTQAVTSRDFARALGKALHRPAFMPTPGLALGLIFGDAAAVLLGSQRAGSRALTSRGFVFAFPTLEAALADIVGGGEVTITPCTTLPAESNPAARQYLASRRPAHTLSVTTIVNAPVEETFAFFSRAGNLGLLTPPAMQFVIETPPSAMTEGATIAYRLRVGPIPIHWRTLIAAWEPGRRFVDLQEAGPYRSWWHEHTFAVHGSGTIMRDRVYYAAPLGPIGRLVNVLFIAPALRQVFRYRSDVIKLRFGASQ